MSDEERNKLKALAIQIARDSDAAQRHYEADDSPLAMAIHCDAADRGIEEFKSLCYEYGYEGDPQTLCEQLVAGA